MKPHTREGSRNQISGYFSNSNNMQSISAPLITGAPTCNIDTSQVSCEYLKMSDEGRVVCYQSDNEKGNAGEDEDEDDVIDDDPPEPVVIPRRRGKGQSWILIAEHPTLIEAMKHIDRVNTPLVTRLTGRITRGITYCYYYTCNMKSCGCTKEWRIRTSIYTEVVYEEVTPGEHIYHNNFKRNGGRGLSDEQVNVFKEAFYVGITKPSAVLNFVERKAELLHNAGVLICY